MPVQQPAMSSERERNMRKCIVCLEEVRSTAFPHVLHGTFERHDDYVCGACWEQHIASRIDSRVGGVVKCPQCDKQLGEPDIRRLASPEVYAR